MARVGQFDIKNHPTHTISGRYGPGANNIQVMFRDHLRDVRKQMRPVKRQNF